jgi:hypothetical protein
MPPPDPIQHLGTLLVPLAHGGHLLVDLPVFLGPVVVIALWLLISIRRGRRDQRDRRA